MDHDTEKDFNTDYLHENETQGEITEPFHDGRNGSLRTSREKTHRDESVELKDENESMTDMKHSYIFDGMSDRGEGNDYPKNLMVSETSEQLSKEDLSKISTENNSKISMNLSDKSLNAEEIQNHSYQYHDISSERNKIGEYRSIEIPDNLETKSSGLLEQPRLQNISSKPNKIGENRSIELAYPQNYLPLLTSTIPSSISLSNSGDFHHHKVSSNDIIPTEDVRDEPEDFMKRLRYSIAKYRTTLTPESEIPTSKLQDLNQKLNEQRSRVSYSLSGNSNSEIRASTTEISPSIHRASLSKSDLGGDPINIMESTHTVERSFEDPVQTLPMNYDTNVANELQDGVLTSSEDISQDDALYNPQGLENGSSKSLRSNTSIVSSEKRIESEVLPTYHPIYAQQIALDAERNTSSKSLSPNNITDFATPSEGKLLSSSLSEDKVLVTSYSLPLQHVMSVNGDDNVPKPSNSVQFPIKRSSISLRHKPSHELLKKVSFKSSPASSINMSKLSSGSDLVVNSSIISQELENGSSKSSIVSSEKIIESEMLPTYHPIYAQQIALDAERNTSSKSLSPNHISQTKSSGADLLNRSNTIQGLQNGSYNSLRSDASVVSSEKRIASEILPSFHPISSQQTSSGQKSPKGGYDRDTTYPMHYNTDLANPSERKLLSSRLSDDKLLSTSYSLPLQHVMSVNGDDNVPKPSNSVHTIKRSSISLRHKPLHELLKKVSFKPSSTSSINMSKLSSGFDLVVTPSNIRQQPENDSSNSSIASSEKIIESEMLPTYHPIYAQQIALDAERNTSPTSLSPNNVSQIKSSGADLLLNQSNISQGIKNDSSNSLRSNASIVSSEKRIASEILPSFHPISSRQTSSGQNSSKGGYDHDTIPHIYYNTDSATPHERKLLSSSLSEDKILWTNYSLALQRAMSVYDNVPKLSNSVDTMSSNPNSSIVSSEKIIESEMSAQPITPSNFSQESKNSSSKSLRSNTSIVSSEKRRESDIQHEVTSSSMKPVQSLHCTGVPCTKSCTDQESINSSYLTPNISTISSQNSIEASQASSFQSTLLSSGVRLRSNLNSSRPESLLSFGTKKSEEISQEILTPIQRIKSQERLETCSLDSRSSGIIISTITPSSHSAITQHPLSEFDVSEEIESSSFNDGNLNEFGTQNVVSHGSEEVVQELLTPTKKTLSSNNKIAGSDEGIINKSSVSPSSFLKSSNNSMPPDKSSEKGLSFNSMSSKTGKFSDLIVQQRLLQNDSNEKGSFLTSDDQLVKKDELSTQSIHGTKVNEWLIERKIVLRELFDRLYKFHYGAQERSYSQDCSNNHNNNNNHSLKNKFCSKCCVSFNNFLQTQAVLLSSLENNFSEGRTDLKCLIENNLKQQYSIIHDLH